MTGVRRPHRVTVQLVATTALVVLFLRLAAVAGTPEAMHYTVQADLDRGSGSLAAKVTIMVPRKMVVSPMVFLLSETALISSLKVTPRATVATSIEKGLYGHFQKITIRAEKPGEEDLFIRLRYKGPLGPSGDPPMDRISADAVELNLDSLWVPVLEGFVTTFTWNAEIRGLGSELVVVAPGHIERSRDRVLIRCEARTSDIAFTAVRGLQRKGTGGFELFARDPSSHPAKAFLHHGIASVKFLEAWFGNLPVRPVRVVMLRRERSGGYSRPGYIVVVDSGDAEAALAKFIAHELGHEWWNTGASDSADRWLSESFAEYVALRYIESELGASTRDTYVASKREATRNAGPLLGPGMRSDVVLYDKGPLLLIGLEERIGRERFDRFLAGMAPNPPDTTAEFLAQLTRLAGKEMARDFEESLRR
jgi:hypothetical protein